ncbi:hypothetical protein HUG17_3834 [Dermatophagoides farinae]|nr:hypothetical protein HUG17_3834 [Dermatophagoides farinae]
MAISPLVLSWFRRNSNQSQSLSTKMMMMMMKKEKSPSSISLSKSKSKNKSKIDSFKTAIDDNHIIGNTKTINDMAMVDFSLTTNTPLMNLNHIHNSNINTNINNNNNNDNDNDTNFNESTTTIWTPSMISDLPSRELQPLNLEQSKLEPLEKSDLFRYRMSMIKHKNDNNENDDDDDDDDGGNDDNDSDDNRMRKIRMEKTKMKTLTTKPVFMIMKKKEPKILIKKQPLLPCVHGSPPETGQRRQNLIIKSKSLSKSTSSFIYKDLPSISIISLRLNNNSKTDPHLSLKQPIDDDQLFAYKRKNPDIRNDRPKIIKQTILEPISEPVKSVKTIESPMKTKQTMKTIKRPLTKFIPKRTKSLVLKGKKFKTKTNKTKLVKNSLKKRQNSLSPPPPRTTNERKLLSKKKSKTKIKKTPAIRKTIRKSPIIKVIEKFIDSKKTPREDTIRWTSDKFQLQSLLSSKTKSTIQQEPLSLRKTSKFYQSPTNYPDY